MLYLTDKKTFKRHFMPSGVVEQYRLVADTPEELAECLLQLKEKFPNRSKSIKRVGGVNWGRGTVNPIPAHVLIRDNKLIYELSYDRQIKKIDLFELKEIFRSTGRALDNKPVRKNKRKTVKDAQTRESFGF